MFTTYRTVTALASAMAVVRSPDPCIRHLLLKVEHFRSTHDVFVAMETRSNGPHDDKENPVLAR